MMKFTKKELLDILSYIDYSYDGNQYDENGKPLEWEINRLKIQIRFQNELGKVLSREVFLYENNNKRA